METQRRNERDAKDAEDLTPTPTQAENDAAMIAATGGEGAANPPLDPEQQRRAEAERKPSEPERRVPAR